MGTNEVTWDKFLQIKTTGRDDSHSDQYHYPYEPTPYSVLARAESYVVPAEVNRCYFFNPFSVELFQKVMARILESYYENPREILLFFYYPSAEYVGYLMTVDELEFYDEINCEDLFDSIDGREQIMIFQIPAPGL